eukprot:jgi/Tetstr1/453778/TSEL_040730.t1
MWLHMAEGLLPAYVQPQPSEAATDQPAATPAGVLALAGVRAWAEYEADTDADDAVICTPTRTLLALLEVCETNEEFADTLRLAVALTSAVALLRTIRLRTIVIYLTESEPVAQDNVNSVREDYGRASSGTNQEAPCRHIASPTTRIPEPTATSSDPSSPDHTPTSAATAMPVAQADDEEELELNYEDNDGAMEVDTDQRKGKAATTAKHKKKQPMGRSRSDGATRNRSMSKPRLSGTRGSDNEWETDDDAAHPSSSSHQ